MTTTDLSGAAWRKSRRSGGGSGQCVEVAACAGLIALRDSKNPTGPYLHLGIPEWGNLLLQLKRLS